MIATCGGIGSAKLLRVLDFPAGIVGVNGVMRFFWCSRSPSLQIEITVQSNFDTDWSEKSQDTCITDWTLSRKVVG